MHILVAPKMLGTFEIINGQVSLIYQGIKLE